MVNPASEVVPGLPFAWWEFSGWQDATDEQRSNLRAVLLDAIGPARMALGVPFDVSQGGWVESRYGGPRDDEAHPTGGAVDFVPRAPVSVLEAYEAIRDLPGAPYGEVIMEGDHVHVTRRGIGGDGEALLLLDTVPPQYANDPMGPAGVLTLELVYEQVRERWWPVLALAGGVWLLARADRK